MYQILAQYWYRLHVTVSCMEHHAFYVFLLWTKQDNPCSPTNIKLLSGMMEISYTALTHWDWILRLDEYKYLLNQMFTLTRKRMLMYRRLMRLILPNRFQRGELSVRRINQTILRLSRTLLKQGTQSPMMLKVELYFNSYCQNQKMISIQQGGGTLVALEWWVIFFCIDLFCWF